MTFFAQVAYVAPVLVLLVGLGITSLRDRRRERREEALRANGPPVSET
jgi:cytochrome c-type biogenesis protein CcmH/NrfF